MFLKKLFFFTFVISQVISQEHIHAKKKLVRRKKLGWDSSDNVASMRENLPVKVLRKKLINSAGNSQKIIKRKVIQPVKQHQPHQYVYPNTSMPSFAHKEEIPTKPSDAKRCKIGCPHFQCLTQKYFTVLSLFTIVSFKNDPCQSLTGNNGTCLSSKDCAFKGGIKSGTCASGFGVCCLSKSSYHPDCSSPQIVFSFQDLWGCDQHQWNILPESRISLHL